MGFTEPVLEDYQKPVVDFIINRPKCGIYLDAGLGKTLCTLIALYRARPAGHILVIAPLKVARSTWLDEVRDWQIPIRTRSLITNENDKKLTRAKRLQRYQEVLDAEKPMMWFINFDLVKDLIDWLPKKHGRPQWPFKTVIIDESQEVKNPQAQRFKALRKIHDQTDRIIELSGTPTPQGMEDLWSQIFLLDGGQALGSKLTEFRSTYFRPSGPVINGRHVNFEPLDWAEDYIYQQRIPHLVISHENTDVRVPKINPIDHKVSLPQAAMDRYNEFKEEMVAEVTDPSTEEIVEITGDHAGVMHNKLLQFASGTLYTGEDHTRDFEVIHEAKLDMTEYLLRNNRGSNAMIAYRYQSDRELLFSRLTDDGYQPVIFDGSRQMVADWNAGKIRSLLLQPASSRHGLNLQHGGNTLIWYTLPDSYEFYHQTNKRLARKGQKEAQVNVHRLIARGTIDAKMPKLLTRKEYNQRRLLDAVKLELKV